MNLHDFRIENTGGIEEGFLEIIVDGYRAGDDDKIYEILIDYLSMVRDIKWNIRICRSF